MAKLNQQQIKNLQKRIRLAKATTGKEHDAHMEAINEMILKYGLIVPDDRLIDENHIADYDEVIKKSF